ncbi:hypothetical protein RchiOBHm_Chr5g0045561 [Rosa chinensis]|uniref:Uncharacterized protein n=1 Tax=Rosa chinensis TaxID=74649 RepID=A0A2P6QDV7_ROSCH|nr:hypothetical protein RchiOBHm_Chr5g0045561 [Rosa chinensis]
MSRIVHFLRVPLLAPSLRGLTIVRLWNGLSSHGSRFIDLHKHVVVFFSYAHGSNKLMKSSDASGIDINLIVLSYHQCRDGEGRESLLDQHHISDFLPTKFHQRLDTKCFRIVVKYRLEITEAEAMPSHF